MPPSDSIPTVPMVGPAGIRVINDVDTDVELWRKEGYTFQDEAREKAWVYAHSPKEEKPAKPVKAPKPTPSTQVEQ